MLKRTTFIFFVLVCYVVLQFLWWEVLLVKQSNQLVTEKQNLVALSSTNNTSVINEIKLLENKKQQRMYMIVGEGTVFLLILLFGIYQVQKSIKKEGRLNEQQTNFLLSVSHELKTPIAASKLQIQTLLKHELTRPQQLQLLSNALQETNRLHKLVENVLLANQIENENLTLHTEKLNLSNLIAETIERYFKLELQQQQIIINVMPNVFCEIDKDLFPSVIINLIENALKYTSEQPKISVTLTEINNQIVFQIADNGCGILDVDKQFIFDKFYRIGSEATRKTKGTGLGLFIVKYICNLHKAKINVISNSPAGTIFKINL